MITTPRCACRASAAVVAILFAWLVVGCGSGGNNNGNESGGAADSRAAVSFVALGDSIAFGLGSSTGRGYIYYFRDFVAAVRPDSDVTVSKRAVPGARSQDLLSLLQNDDLPGTRTLVQGADIVTISIGGNNLLRCSSDNYRNFDTGCAMQNTAQFETDWPAILEEIRARIGSRARLYVITLYNPYPGDAAGYAVVDPYVRRINAAIADPGLQAAYNYAVIDVYADFSGKNAQTGAWNVCGYTHFCDPGPDVHPTDAGHAEIARLHESRYP